MQIKSSWQALEEGWWAVNSAGTLQEKGGGWRVAIRDSRGDMVAAAHGSTELQNINHIEPMAMEKGIQLAAEMECTRLILQSDSMNAIGYINGTEIP